MATVFLDGHFLSRDDARISAFDAGFQHGVGLFETMLAVRRGRPHVLHLEAHLERLRQSALTLGLASVMHTGALAEAVQRTADKAAEEIQSPKLRLRLTLSGGDLNLLGRGGEGQRRHEPTLLIVAQPATEYPAEMFERGTLATLADFRANPFDPTQGHKTLSYWPRLRELQIAAGKGAGEALVFSVTNHLVGGCVSNAFMVRGGELLTPIARGEEEEVAHGEQSPDTPPARGARGAVLPSPVLPGIVRRWIMDWAIVEGIPCRQRMLSLDDVLRADEVFLTNSSWGVLPVTRLEAERIAKGEVGELTGKLVAAWSELSAIDAEGV